MNNTADQKIKNILKDLSKAQARSEQFSVTKPLDPFEIRKPTDIYDMALAYENKERILLQLELAYSERYPENYTVEQVVLLKKEIQRLTRRIRAWQNRQFPGQYRK